MVMLTMNWWMEIPRHETGQFQRVNAWRKLLTIILASICFSPKPVKVTVTNQAPLEMFQNRFFPPLLCLRSPALTMCILSDLPSPLGNSWNRTTFHQIKQTNGFGLGWVLWNFNIHSLFSEWRMKIPKMKQFLTSRIRDYIWFFQVAKLHFFFRRNATTVFQPCCRLSLLNLKLVCLY